MTLGKVLILEQRTAYFQDVDPAGGMGGLFVRAGGLDPGEAVLADMETVRARRPDPADYAGVIVTGSLAMASDGLPWMLELREWLAAAVAGGLPVLGVCFGHHILALALGGEVGWHPSCQELGPHEINFLPGAPPRDDDPLLCGLPDRFAAFLAHSQTVSRPPRGAKILARSALDPHQILSYGPGVLGVQFHPEFTQEIVDVFVKDDAPPHPGGPQKVLLGDAPVGSNPAAGIIRRFVNLAANGRRTAAAG
ncbi:MAG: gamma-glutamyl-gamma-aminobutyrate hydrolase family protein [Deltaproteobacteria bacterium]|jgi:GMP synthase-like glutamine amidotransferase|nr:gamma-glutamyl-gamma-aminobutyrate hydrolase family protein [Deltaproteobacteria bacterium]